MAHLRASRSNRQQEQSTGVVIVRRDSPEDAEAVERLAQLDSVHRPYGPVLLAVVGGEPRARRCPCETERCWRIRFIPQRSSSSFSGSARRSCLLERLDVTVSSALTPDHAAG